MPIPKDKMFSSAFHGHQTLIYYTDTHTEKTPIHTHTETTKTKQNKKKAIVFKQNVVAQTFNPSTQETEAAGF